MSEHDDRLPMHQMLEHAREAMEIAHGYDRIDYDVIWDTIAEHFPALVVALERALSGESS